MDRHNGGKAQERHRIMQSQSHNQTQRQQNQPHTVDAATERTGTCAQRPPTNGQCFCVQIEKDNATQTKSLEKHSYSPHSNPRQECHQTKPTKKQCDHAPVPGVPWLFGLASCCPAPPLVFSYCLACLLHLMFITPARSSTG